MRGSPSKSRSHRTPASSLLDRRHRRSIHNKGEDAHGPTSRLNPIATCARSAVQIVPRLAPLVRLQKFSRGHNFARDQLAQRTTAHAPARGPTRILVGGSEALNHVLADTGGRGRAHVDAAKFGAVGNQRPVVKRRRPPGGAAQASAARARRICPGAGAPARPSRRPTRA